MVAMLAACDTRERLTFPSENPGDGRGPVTEITQPDTFETVAIAGHPLIVAGRTFDPDGVDTVYIGVSGVNQGFPPILGEGRDTVNFSVQLSTFNSTGATVLVEVYGVDRLGDDGRVVSRRIHIE